MQRCSPLWTRELWPLEKDVPGSLLVITKTLLSSSHLVSSTTVRIVLTQYTFFVIVCQQPIPPTYPLTNTAVPYRLLASIRCGGRCSFE